MQDHYEARVEVCMQTIPNKNLEKLEKVLKHMPNTLTVLEILLFSDLTVICPVTACGLTQSIALSLP